MRMTGFGLNQNIPVEIKAMIETRCYGNYAEGGTIDPNTEAKLNQGDNRIHSVCSLNSGNCMIVSASTIGEGSKPNNVTNQISIRNKIHNFMSITECAGGTLS